VPGAPRLVCASILWQSIVDLVALLLAVSLVTVLNILKDGDAVAADVVAGLQSNTSLLPAVLVFSVILTAIHWFVRPLLLIFFGGWLMRSFGLFALILDIVLFSVAVLLAPVQVQSTAVAWWSIPVAAVVYDIVDFALVVVVGLNRPRPDGKRRHEAVWRQLERLPSMRRNWMSEKLRLEEASSTLLSYGLEIGLANTPSVNCADGSRPLYTASLTRSTPSRLRRSSASCSSSWDRRTSSLARWRPRNPKPCRRIG
jgi:uncharacterized membrane protein YvlD (DUF360 family)